MIRGLECKGRLIVVSGGGTGIGRAIAGRFAASGDTVLIIGRREHVVSRTAEELNENLRGAAGRVIPVSGDVSDPRFLARFKDQLEATEDGRVDVLVNCAGGAVRGPDSSLDEIAATWTENYRSNVLTAVLLTETLDPRLRRPGGRIVNFSSIAAFRGGGGPYSAAKGAVTSWTFDLAARLGPEGITANVVVPGYIEDTEFFGDRMTAERRARLIAQTLDGRAGRPEDVAAVVFFLASAEASHITGQVVHVNGGALFGR